MPRIVMIAVVLIPLGVSVALVIGAQLADPPTLGPVRGVRLGHTPSQARDRFSPDSPGDFRGTATGEDFALIWTPSAPGELRSARLEFHLGLLVALRLELLESAPEASGAPIELTEGSVLSRERPSPEGGPGSARVTWLSRSCPTHVEEVRGLIGDDP